MMHFTKNNLRFDIQMLFKCLTFHSNQIVNKNNAMLFMCNKPKLAYYSKPSQTKVHNQRYTIQTRPETYFIHICQFHFIKSHYIINLLIKYNIYIYTKTNRLALYAICIKISKIRL